jgi:UDP-N-acetylmuramate-alanine ligase
VEKVIKTAKPNDVIITLGAGSITQAATKILDGLQKIYERLL